MPRYFCQKNIENSLEESKILQDFSSVKPLQSKLFTTESPEENRGVKSIRDWFIIHTYQNHKWQTMQSRFAPFRKHKTEHFLKAEHQFPIENFVDTTSANSNKTEFAFCVRTNPVILFTNCFWISGNDKDEHSIYLKIQRSDKKPIPIAAAHTNYFPATTRVKTSGHFVVTISPYGVFELFSSVNIPVILDYNQLVKKKVYF